MNKRIVAKPISSSSKKWTAATLVIFSAMTLSARTSHATSVADVTDKNKKHKFSVEPVTQIQVEQGEGAEFSFFALNKKHRFKLKKLSIFTPGAKLAVLDGSASEKSSLAESHTYHAQSDTEWGSVTFFPDGKIRGVISDAAGRKWQFEHVNRLKGAVSPADQVQIQSAASENYVLHDRGITDEGATCGNEVVAPGAPEDSLKDILAPAQTPAVNSSGTDTSSDGVISTATLPLGQGITPFFPSCYPQDTAPRSYQIGIASDLGYFKIAGGNVAQVQAEIESTVGPAIIIYLAQLNIHLKVSKIIITQSAQGAPLPFTYDRTGGFCNDISSVLSQVVSWHQSVSQTDASIGSWQMFTDCFPPAGVVGMGYIGNLCSAYSSAVSSYYSGQWLAFAHELGHNFGALHTFGLGGIMDYSNGVVNDTVQFASANRPQICGELNKDVNVCQSFAFEGSGSCGNGVLEPSEDCECLNGTDSCNGCVKCKLPTDKKIQCSSSEYVMRSPGDSRSYISADSTNLSNSECCTQTGQVNSPETACGGGQNVCVSGQCKKVCQAWGLKSCGMENSGCTQQCIYPYGGTPQCMDNIKTQSTGIVINWIPDGTGCGNGGLCASGSCVGSSSPSPTPSVSPSPQPSPSVSPSPKPSPSLSPSPKPSPSPSPQPSPSPSATPQLPPQVKIVGTVNLNGPRNTVLQGSAVTYNGKVSQWKWTQTKGPNQARFVSPANPRTRIRGLLKGSYVFKLTATDGVGAIGSAQVTVTVKK